MIYTLTDRDYNPLDAIEVSTGLIGQYISSIIETLDLTIPTGTPNWVEGNYIFCQDAAGRNYWFNISKREESLNGHEIKLTCYSGSLDVLSESAPEIKTETAQTLQWYFNQLYMDTGITLGINDFTTRKEIVSVEISQSTAEATNTILQAFGAEGRFDAEIVQCVPKSLTLNVYSRIGQVESQALLSDEDASLTKLDYTSDLSNLATAIKPYGKTGDNDQAVSLTDKLYEYKDAAGKVLYNSPKGSPFIFSVEGHEKYFVKLKAKSEAEGYILKRYSGDEDTPDKLWANALALLKTLDRAKVTYSMAGFATCKLGDTVTVEVQSMSDLIIISARVTELRFNDDDPAKNEYVFSNYKELSTNIESIDKLVARIASQVTDLSSKTKTFVTTDTIVPIQDAVEKAQTTADNANAAVDELSKVAVVQGTFDKMQEAIAKSLTDQATKAQESLDTAKATLQTAADTANKNAEARHAAYLEETAATAKLIEAAQADATTAISKGEDALKAADGVSTKVTQQAALITAAQTAADNASKKAISVELTAEGLAKTIASVKTTADGAMTASHTAQETADGLATTIATVKTTAEGAVETANTAKTTADGMVTTLTSTTETAKNAASAASTANTQITTINQTLKEYGVSMADMMTKTDFKVENGKITIAIQDAKDYATGEIAKVEVHTAYAWSADGTDRFTTVYPGENLVLKSALSTDGDDSVKPTHVDGKWILTDAKSVWPTIPDIYTRLDSSKKYSFSFKIKKTAGVIRGLGGHSLIFEAGSQQIYLDGVLLQSVTSWPLANIEIDDNLTHTIQVVARIVPNLTGDNRLYIQIGRRGGYADIYSAEIWDLKVEEGQVATVYTPAPTEDPVNAYPHYVGTSLKGSDNPADYTWQLDPAYLSIMSEMALQGKLDNDSFYEALDGKVNTEDFLETQELAQTLSDSFKAFTTETFVAEINKLEERSDGLVVNLNNKLADFSFLTTYIKLGEEGLVIGANDSSLKMLLSKDKLAFIDGGETVAYFTNQSFFINRGAIVQSLQVGSHKMVKLNDDHTIFQFVSAS